MNLSGFLDTNILANWVFIDAALKTRNANKKELFDLLSSYVPSYLLMEQIKTDRRLQGVLSTSRLAYAEILSVLIDQYVEERMHAHGIPARYFTRERNSIHLSVADVTDIAKQAAQLTHSFFVQTKHFIEFVGDEYNYPDFVTLLTTARIETYDAILIATALTKKCAYFITEDGRLRDAVKKGDFSIDLVSAQEYLSRLPKLVPSTEK